MAEDNKVSEEGLEQAQAMDYEKIADKVYRLMKAELTHDRERAARSGGQR